MALLRIVLRLQWCETLATGPLLVLRDLPFDATSTLSYGTATLGARFPSHGLALAVIDDVEVFEVWIDWGLIHLCLCAWHAEHLKSAESNLT